MNIGNSSVSNVFINFTKMPKFIVSVWNMTGMANFMFSGAYRDVQLHATDYMNERKLTKKNNCVD